MNYEVPNCAFGVNQGIYDTKNNSCVGVWTEIEKNEYTAYIQQLKSSGYAEKATYILGKNDYTFLNNGEQGVYVSFLPRSGKLRVAVSTANDLFPYDPAEPADEKYSETVLWQLMIDAKTTKLNGGMSYVLRLKNGHFIIIDGGYNTSLESRNLYELLRENTAEGEKPVIAAWFITHLHGDHYGCFLNFSKKFSDKVELRAMYYNFPGHVVGGVGYGDYPAILKAAARWPDCVLYERLHSGMTLQFAEVTVEIIFTHEDMFPAPVATDNETSTVMRFQIAGQTVFFPGDARETASAEMLSAFAPEELKSDIVQVSHHGYEGLTPEMYQAIDAPVVLWPMNIVGWQETYKTVPQNVFGIWKRNLPANKYLIDSERVQKIIVAGEGPTALAFPYRPTGARLVDDEAIFKAYCAIAKNQYL